MKSSRQRARHARKFLEELEFSMAHKQRIRSYVLMCALGLLVLPSGRDALTCCRRDFSNGSTSCQLSNAPDPTCDTEWIADDIVVVDETGEMDPTRVQHAEPQTLVLKDRHTNIIFQMDCAATKNLVKLSCNDLCPSSDDLTTATAESQRTNNAGNKSTNDGIFIILSIIIIFFTRQLV